MRRLCTAEEIGLTRSAMRWAEKKGRWRKIDKGVYGEGPEEPSELDRARARAIASRGVAGGSLAAVLYGLDGVELRLADISVGPAGNGRRAGARRRCVPEHRIVEIAGVRCVDGLQTLVDLATELGDLEWEQALESALRKRLTSIAAVEAVAASSVRGVARMRRVLALRPLGAPPTESLLETLMVQLARTIPGLPDPARQVDVYDADGNFVARVDLAWPELGLFIELDGQHHKDQPVYDARRETAVVAATGWLCGRFTWREVVDLPTTTARRLAALAEQARRRPLPLIRL